MVLLWGGGGFVYWCLFPFMSPNCIKFMVPFGGPPLLELFYFSPNFPFHPVGTISCIHWGFIYDTFFWFHSPPNCNNFTVPFGVHGCLLFSHSPHLAQLQQVHGSVRRPPLMIFFFLSCSILHFTNLQQFRWAFVEGKEQKVDNRSDQVILWWDSDTSCNAHSTDMQSWRPDSCFRIYSCYDYLPILTVTSTVHLQEIMQLWL